MNNLQNGMLGWLGGIRIIENYHLVKQEQFRFPRDNSNNWIRECHNIACASRKIESKKI